MAAVKCRFVVERAGVDVIHRSDVCVAASDVLTVLWLALAGHWQSPSGLYLLEAIRA